MTIANQHSAYRLVLAHTTYLVQVVMNRLQTQALTYLLSISTLTDQTMVLLNAGWSTSTFLPLTLTLTFKQSFSENKSDMWRGGNVSCVCITSILTCFTTTTEIISVHSTLGLQTRLTTWTSIYRALWINSSSWRLENIHRQTNQRCFPRQGYKGSVQHVFAVLYPRETVKTWEEVLVVLLHPVLTHKSYSTQSTQYNEDRMECKQSLHDTTKQKQNKYCSLWASYIILHNIYNTVCTHKKNKQKKVEKYTSTKHY